MLHVLRIRVHEENTHSLPGFHWYIFSWGSQCQWIVVQDDLSRALPCANDAEMYGVLCPQVVR